MVQYILRKIFLNHLGLEIWSDHKMVKYPESCCFRCDYFRHIAHEFGVCGHGNNAKKNTGNYSHVIRKTEGTLCSDFKKKKK